MDRAKVAMLMMSSAMYELSPELEDLADSTEFWETLEATPEDQLLPEQIKMLEALEVTVPDQNS